MKSPTAELVWQKLPAGKVLRKSSYQSPSLTFQNWTWPPPPSQYYWYFSSLKIHLIIWYPEKESEKAPFLLCMWKIKWKILKWPELHNAGTICLISLGFIYSVSNILQYLDYHVFLFTSLSFTSVTCSSHKFTFSKSYRLKKIKLAVM